jgi:hypothetical protein
VVFPIVHRPGTAVTVATLGRDDRLALDVGDWVEVVDDDYAIAGSPEQLRRVVEIHPDERLVTLDEGPSADAGTGTSPELHPFLRRWDQDPGPKAVANDNAIVVDARDWIELEDGVKVKFEAGIYLSGDFWTIPARVETGNVIWPPGTDADPHPAREPEGVSCFYAPLAYLGPQGRTAIDLRCIFPTLDCDGGARLPSVRVDSVADTTAAPAPRRRQRRARGVGLPGPRRGERVASRMHVREGALRRCPDRS